MLSLKRLSFLILGPLLITTTSCGGGQSNSLMTMDQQRQDDQGIYRVVLKPLNSGSAGFTSGVVEIKIKGDDVSVFSSVTDSPVGVKHLQNIITSSHCPDTDTNSDGFIDIAETLIHGQILIPLDSDLDEQLEGMDFGPIANDEGSYVYRKSSSLSKLLSDLHAFDPDPLDKVVKIFPEHDLNLSDKVLIIHGVDSSLNLPPSVATMGALSKEQSLPIACGKINRLTGLEESLAPLN